MKIKFVKLYQDDTGVYPAGTVFENVKIGDGLCLFSQVYDVDFPNDCRPRMIDIPEEYIIITSI